MEKEDSSNENTIKDIIGDAYDNPNDLNAQFPETPMSPPDDDDMHKTEDDHATTKVQSPTQDTHSKTPNIALSPALVSAQGTPVRPTRTHSPSTPGLNDERINEFGFLDDAADPSTTPEQQDESNEDVLGESYNEEDILPLPPSKLTTPKQPMPIDNDLPGFKDYIRYEVLARVRDTPRNEFRDAFITKKLHVIYNFKADDDKFYTSHLQLDGNLSTLVNTQYHAQNRTIAFDIDLRFSCQIIYCSPRKIRLNLIGDLLKPEERHLNVLVFFTESHQKDKKIRRTYAEFARWIMHIEAAERGNLTLNIGIVRIYQTTRPNIQTGDFPPIQSKTLCLTRHNFNMNFIRDKYDDMANKKAKLYLCTRCRKVCT